MSILWMDPTLAVLCTVGIGGSALGLFGLLRSKPLGGFWRVAAVTLAVLAVGLAARAAWLGQAAGFWAPPLALAGVCLAFRFVRSAAAGRLAGWLGVGLRSHRCQATGLLLGSFAFAGWWTVWITDVPEPPGLEQALELLTDDWGLSLEELSPGLAWTDEGRPLRLHASRNPLPVTEELRAKQSAILRRFNLQERVIALPNADQNCNCHGWAFTGGRYWVSPGDVEHLLRDNGYQIVSQPQAGDLVVYRAADGGKIIHTGVVRLANEGLLLVESKWGAMGRFLHPHDAHCYGEPECQFYRSRRPGHLVRGLPGTPGATAPAVATAPQNPPAQWQTPSAVETATD